MRLVKNSLMGLKGVNRRHIVPASDAPFELSGGRSSLIFGLEAMRRDIDAKDDKDIADALKAGRWVLIKEPPPNLGSAALTKSSLSETPTLLRAPEPWPATKQPVPEIFAKSCIPNHRNRTGAGIATEPADNFGQVMIPKPRRCRNRQSPSPPRLGRSLR